MTNSEYAAFLNAVAATDTYSLWHQSMSIERTGLGGDYTYSVVDGKGEHPVVRVNFYDAARFTNWLMNGQPTGSQGSNHNRKRILHIFWSFYDQFPRNAISK